MSICAGRPPVEEGKKSCSARGGLRTRPERLTEAGGECSSAGTAASGSGKSPEEPSSNSGTWACQWESEPGPYTSKVWSYLVHYVPDILSFATLRSSVLPPRYFRRLAQCIHTRPESLLGPRIDDSARPFAPSKMVAEPRRLAYFTTDRALFTHGGEWLTARQQHAVT